MAKDVVKRGILFLCTGNSCRSQMAEGFAKKLALQNRPIYSAGIEAHGLNPKAVQVMKEIGIDISHQISKTVDSIPKDKIGTVITVCGHANETCPVFPEGVKRLHWDIEDPAKAKGSEEEVIKVFRRVRDTLQRKIEDFFKNGH